MSTTELCELSVLEISLHDWLVGHLLGYSDGRNFIHFDQNFVQDRNRPTLSLITHPLFPNVNKVLERPWGRHQRLHPVLSNLLPEGALRELIAQSSKVHVDNEFRLLSLLGGDLPGAVVARATPPEQIPKTVLKAHRVAKVVPLVNANPANKFSLAGVQMKFSMKAIRGRYTLTAGNDLGDWIIKTPSVRHRHVPLNEYTAMSLAAMVGIDTPEFKLVDLATLDDFPPINLPAENKAFAIKRFDREDHQRVHMEDFAQILVKYPHQKYVGANYEQVAKIIFNYSGDGLADVQQFAKRLLVNILLANGDAHLKNWSFLYADQVTPRLSPAYDILTTSVYIAHEVEYALNLGGTKAWYDVSLLHFEAWAKKAGLPWRAIKPHLAQAIAAARALWPQALSNLPMPLDQQKKLIEHWRRLHPHFAIKL